MDRITLIILLWLLFVITFYIILIYITGNDTTETKPNYIIKLYNPDKNKVLNFESVYDFYEYTKATKAESMILYLRKHGFKENTPEEVKEIIKIYYSDYIIKKLDF